MTRKHRTPAPANKSTSAAIMAAALALPISSQVWAETPPERALISVKHLDYLDYQPDQDRIRVKATSWMLSGPLSENWSASGTYTTDSLSGASPRYYSFDDGPGGAFPKMKDKREAYDFSLTRYFERATLTLGASDSKETDYVSKSLSLQGTLSSDDNNTTYNFGVGGTQDRINPSNLAVIDETKGSTDWLFGVTQVLTQNDIVQLNLVHSQGSGYYSDPYKAMDNRPRIKDRSIVLARWNHHFADLDATSRLSYRYYVDSFDVKAHTFEIELVKPLPHGWTVTPLLRLYSQTRASFYLEANPADRPGPTFPDATAQYVSLDQRLSGFGALTYGIKVVKQLDRDWAIDLKLEKYEQRGGWAFVGDGSKGLDPFMARSIQFGLSKYF